MRLAQRASNLRTLMNDNEQNTFPTGTGNFSRTSAGGFVISISAMFTPSVGSSGISFLFRTGTNPSPRHLRCCTKLRSEEHTSELQSRLHLVCRLLLEKKKKKNI